jgi:hypothetical protein
VAFTSAHLDRLLQPAGTDGLVVVPAWLDGQSAA